MEPDIGEREKGFMKKKIKYTDEPIGEIKIVDDFLPSPDQIALKEKNVKVTLNLRESSVKFFKNVANKHGLQYQKLIRRLLDEYASKHSGSNL